MTAPSSIDPAHFLHEQLAQASPDLLRQMLTTFINTLMSAEADAVCGAEYGARSAERTNVRNGYRAREFDTRAGTLNMAIPKLRTGSYFPDWLLERRRRAERALTTVVATCYLLGVSTRRMEKLVESLGITRLSKSQVSEMAKDLDAQVAEESEPASAVLGGGDLQAEDLPMPVGVDAGGDQGVDRDHPAAFADLEHQRVGGDEGERPRVGQGSGAEVLHVRVEVGRHRADL